MASWAPELKLVSGRQRIRWRKGIPRAGQSLSAFTGGNPIPHFIRVIRRYTYSMPHWRANWTIGLLLPAAICQSTHGIISGRVYDEATGRAIAGARVVALYSGTDYRNIAVSEHNGWYSLPALSPGGYFLRVTAEGYQSRETNHIELAVSGRMQLDVPLRYLGSSKAPAYDAGFVPGTPAFVHTYTADVQTTRIDVLTVLSGIPGILDSSLSYVVSPAEVERLPLSGRDLYTTLALQPGVNSYVGTGRGLGLTVTGQTPSSINFLLDGVENNNHLTSGPLTSVVPESMREYRISTHNYSAEYGRTSGAVANAVSHSGLEGWHGLVYSYFKNAALNASGFQESFNGFAPSPLHETELGTSVGGPLGHKWYFSVPFDYLRYRNRSDSQKFRLPAREFIEASPLDRAGAQLLRKYALAVAPSAPDLNSAEVQLTTPIEIDRYTAVPRVDFAPDSEGRHRFFARLSTSQLRQPGLFASPYPDLSAPFRQNGTSIAVGHTYVPGPSISNEVRLARSGDSMRLDRVHSELPFSAAGDQVYLPASPAAFTFHHSARDTEALDNISLFSGRNIWKFGGGALWRTINEFADLLAGGQYTFDDVARFAEDQPSSLLLTYDRSRPGEAVKPPFRRQYRYAQYYLFGQQSIRISRRLQVNFGVRYERFGAPRSTGAARDYLIQPGPGSTIAERLAGASWALSSGDLYPAQPGDIAVRGGVAYDLLGSGHLIFRGGYGLFYDRPFDNMWQIVLENRLQFGYSNFALDGHQRIDILQPPYSLSATYRPDSYDDPLAPVMFQQGLQNPRVQQFFAALQQTLPGTGFLELAYAGALGDRLLTTDKINRPFSTSGRTVQNPLALINSSLPLVSYRANQGTSSYHALTATLRFLTRRVRGQVAYTWSHSIDLQSEPLAGEFLDFNFFNAQGAAQTQVATFTRQFDPQSDRGNSDFDQRHNLVLYAIADLPPAFGATRFSGIFRDWQAAATGAIRSGFPYTVYARPDYYRDGVETLYNNRPDLESPDASRIYMAAPGGRRLLDTSAFGPPPSGAIGSLGRNSFAGPGVVSLDASISRTFKFRRSESPRLTLRCDAYNLFNHVNLNNPVSTTIGSSQFGYAPYGREEINAGFPLLTPFRESARTLQLMLRLQF